MRALTLCITALALASLACNTFFPPRPAIVWDVAPDAVIIQATFGGGLEPVTLAQNRIPDVRVWGDGHMLWVDIDNQGQRHVYETYLSTDEMRDYIQHAENVGFFGWQDFYADHNVLDAGTRCLRISLQSVVKGVCQYVVDTPPAFGPLYDEITAGLNKTGQAYKPTTGFLTATPFNTGGQNPSNALRWSADSIGFSLRDATNGAWIEGPALDAAWELVNANIWSGIAQEGDTYYSLVLHIPGVTQIEPPTP